MPSGWELPESRAQGKAPLLNPSESILLSEGGKLAVLAIDPSSERSKGSILGDKTRMEELAGRPEAYIRPSPSGGTLGGVARKTTRDHYPL